MHFIDGIISSIQTILSHKFRSFLTLLGIIIGVTSVVAMFSSVNGLKLIIHKQMESLGFDNSLVVSPGTEDSNTRRRGFGIRRSWSANRKIKPLTYNDFQSLKAEIEVKYVYGLIERWAMSPDRNWMRVIGTNVDFFKSKTYPIKEGRFFNSFEMKNAKKVCVLGYYYAQKNFINENPIGKFITSGDHRYQVIGILDEDKLSQGNAFNMNNWQRNWDLQAIYIPLKTAAVYHKNNMALDSIVLQAKDSESFNYMRNHTRQVLLAKHNMSKDFSFEDIGSYMLEMTQEIDEFQKKWSITLLAIASISLIVGGIGLFSTLLISINERMNEIGVRKSIGARDKDIFFYFIIEALTLSFIAACFGIIFGFLITKILGLAIGISVPISIMSIYIGFFFSLLIGFISGLYPAYKAAVIDPIQAIYYFE
ncbi:MAG: ABC transporter permease [Candidatus Cloacimonetes bacterium]|jgi:putative ABC transport system permease protein|nr:ABC transporter permease [Candidatus Cloacimonadota bacterium]MDD4155880.1 ABC transporter permease [Candidatus Cloacimonadota bacterium]